LSFSFKNRPKGVVFKAKLVFNPFFPSLNFFVSMRLISLVISLLIFDLSNLMATCYAATDAVTC